MVSPGRLNPETLQETLDTNTNATSSIIEMVGRKYIGVYVCGITGTHATHIITLQISPNGTDWFDTADTITGEGYVKQDLIISDQARVKVTTTEGATSTSKVFVIVE